MIPARLLGKEDDAKTLATFEVKREPASSLALLKPNGVE